VPFRMCLGLRKKGHGRFFSLTVPAGKGSRKGMGEDVVPGCLSRRVAIKVKARKNVAPDRLAVSFRAAR